MLIVYKSCIKPSDVLRCIVSRVVSSDISGGKFPEIYSNLSGNC